MSRHRNPTQSTEIWTEERLERLKTLWLGGLSAAKTAKALGGISRSAVLSKVYRLGIGRPAPAKPRLAKPIVPPKPPRKSRAKTPRSPHIPVGGSPRTQPNINPERAIPSLILAKNGNRYYAPPPVPLPPLRTVVADNPRPLVELGSRDCHNPVNDGEHPRHGWLYCGEPVVGEGAYCPRCRAINIDIEGTAQAAQRGGEMRFRPGLGYTRRVGRGTSGWVR